MYNETDKASEDAEAALALLDADPVPAISIEFQDQAKKRTHEAILAGRLGNTGQPVITRPQRKVTTGEMMAMSKMHSFLLPHDAPVQTHSVVVDNDPAGNRLRVIPEYQVVNQLLGNTVSKPRHLSAIKLSGNKQLYYGHVHRYGRRLQEVASGPTITDASFGTGWWHKPEGYSVSNIQDPVNLPFLQPTFYQFDPSQMKHFNANDWLDNPFDPSFTNENTETPYVIGTYLRTPPLEEAGFTISFAFLLKTLHPYHEYDLLSSGFMTPDGEKGHIQGADNDGYFRIVVRGAVGNTPHHIQVYGSGERTYPYDLHARPNGHPGPGVYQNHWNIIQVVVPAADSSWAAERARVYLNGNYIGVAPSDRIARGPVALSGYWGIGARTQGNGVFHGRIQNFFTFARELSDLDREAVYGHTYESIHNYAHNDSETGYIQASPGTYPPNSYNLDTLSFDPDNLNF